MDEFKDIYEAIDFLYASVQDFHRHETFSADPDPQHPRLVPTLKPYQRRAVQWMLSRESKKVSIDDLIPSNTSISTSAKPLLLPTGGILADEMGLGKTVEVLACILLNPRKFTEEEQMLAYKSTDSGISPNAVVPLTDSSVEVVIEPSPTNTYSKRKRCKVRISDEETECTDSVSNENQRDKNVEIASRVKIENLKNSSDDESLNIKTEPSFDPVVEEDSHCPVEKVVSSRERIKHEPPERTDLSDNNANVNQKNEMKGELQLEEVPLTTEDISHEPAEFSSNCNRGSKKFFSKVGSMETDSLEVDPNLDSKEKFKKGSEIIEMEVNNAEHNSVETNNSETDPIDMSASVHGIDQVETKCVIQADPFDTSIENKHVISEADPLDIKTIASASKRKSSSLNETPDTSPKKRAKSAKPLSAIKQALNEWYEAMLSEMTPKSRTAIQYPVSNLHCFCNNERESGMVQCTDCQFYQHKRCVNFNGKKIKACDYLCPTCILKKKPIRSKTTFIVSPSSISTQWIDEIEKHTSPSLKVLKYEGVRTSGYIQPTTIAEYDVLLTTYETLSRELNYVSDEMEGASRSMRHAKRYFSPQSPLPCLEWWRICLDEAQMVEITTNRPSQMTKKLAAIHRWAVTGTPIQKTVDDLMGLIEFLGLDELALPRNWKALRENSDEFLYFLSCLMWRHSKHEVIHEFGVPPQTVKCVWLKFSAIESHFYKRQHMECSGQFLAKVARYPSLNIPLRTIDRREVSIILTPLLALRQACSHPQAVRGKLLSRKATMTMTELLDIMVKKTQSESEEFLRQYISALNGKAGLHIIIDEVGEAIKSYREVLQLCQNYEGSLTADTLQKIHTLHNLGEIIELKPEEVAPTIRDASVKEDAAALEKEYLDKKRAVMTNTRQQAASFAAEVSKLCNGATLGFSEWWVNVIDSAPSSKELLTQLKSAIAGASDNFVSIAPKISSKEKLKVNLAIWLADMDSLRLAIIQNLRVLEITCTQDLVHKALCCHLRKSKKSNSKTCLLCETEEELKTYESLLFMISTKAGKTNHLNEESEDEEEVTDEMEPSSSKASSSLKALKQVTVFEASWKGSWKNSQYLILLLELCNFARASKGIAENWQNDAKQHLKLMNVLKREFKTLRMLWTQNSELVQSCDELVMAKMRLRARIPSDTPKKKAKNKMDHIHIIEPHQIAYELHRLRNECIVAADNLKRKTGTLLYLKNLQKEKSEDKVNICPICHSEMKDKWVVLVCGHCICYECIPTLLSLSISTERGFVECAVCREKNLVAEISYVDCQETPNDGAVKGSYSTKVEGVIRLVQKLKLDNSDIKILVFSTWEKVLDILEEGFQKNSISCERLRSGSKSKNSIKNFKSKKDVNVLLLQFKSGAKGLNLIEATHIILVEPVLNPSDELQAVGRVHRMGQTKPTFVHRFVIENTIEEKMLSAIKDNDINKWRQNQVTLKQLSDLFTYELNSRIESTAPPNS